MEKPSLPRIAYNSLIDDIVDGKLKLGQPVSQIDLTKMLNMSRTPVREALFALERDGILEKNGRKYSVCYISKSEVRELYEARAELEAVTTKLCIENMTPELRRNITNLMRRIKNETFSPHMDPYTLADLNGRIHMQIASGSNNRYLGKFLREIVLKLKIVRVAILNSAERSIAEYEEHANLVERLLEGDRKGAVEAMLAHRGQVAKFTEEKILNRLFYDDE